MNDLHDREFHPLKILHHFDRLHALAQGRDTAPITVEIDPVAWCNHGCGWCVDPVHEPVAMPFETSARLTAELAEFAIDGAGVKGIVFKGGGEPTLHPQLGDMVTHARGLGFAVGVVTNGSLLARWCDPLASSASYVRVSIDGPTPESHARIHRSHDFDAILTGVRGLVAARGDRRHPVIGLTFAMDIHTVGLAAEAIRLGEALGADYVLLRPPFFEEVGRKSTMTPAEAGDVRRQLAAVAADHRSPLAVMIGHWIGDRELAAVNADAEQPSGRREIRVGRNLPIEHRTRRCLASPLLAVVTADGTLYGCCNLRALPAWSFGRLDYNRGIGFAALWTGPQRQSVLARMHCAKCLVHCTHPLSRYNEIIEVLCDPLHPHTEFV